jgi:hypothetical protein
MNLNKCIGLCLLAICLIILPVYLALVFFPLEFFHFLNLPTNGSTVLEVRIYAGLIPVTVAFVAFLIFCAWMGFCIATSKRKEIDNNSPSSTSARNTCIRNVSCVLAF